MKIDKLKVGQTVFSVEKRDTRILSMSKSKKPLKTIAVYDVYITEINVDEGYVIARWNGNEGKKFYENSIAKWKKEKPMTIKEGFGIIRLATKEERDAAKLKNKK